MPVEHSTDAQPRARRAARCDPARSADARLGAVSSLLGSLETPPRRRRPSLLDSAELALENKLVQVRLGIASSLFAAPAAKHAPTAHHSLRVALSCSAWGAMLGWPMRQRDELEVAALLHDIGKIGVPDTILLKPAPLTPDEYHVVERHRQVGADILRLVLHVGRGHANRAVCRRLVRRQPRRARARGRRAAAGRADGGDRRCVRRDDHRPGLSPRLCRASGPWPSCSNSPARNSIRGWCRSSAATSTPTRSSCNRSSPAAG